METTKGTDDDAKCMPPGPNAGDLELARSTVQRQPEALDRFAERMRCIPRFLSARNTQLGGGLSREAIEDLTQDVITVIWRKLPSYRGDAALETWAWRFCELELRSALRRATTRRVVSHVDPIDLSSHRAQQNDSPADPERIQQALDQLPVDDAVAVRLKHFEALTFEEAAARLGISPNTVKTRYYRAIAHLGQVLRRHQEHRS